MMTSRHRTCLVAVTLALTAALATAAPPPVYQAWVLPPASAGGFELPNILPQAFNDNGQVVALANDQRNGFGFRFSPGAEPEVLHAEQDFIAWPTLINNRGDVAGRRLFAAGGPERLFLYTDDNGLETLEDEVLGSRRVEPRGLNELGHVLTIATFKNPRRELVSLRHVPGEGWTDLRGLDPELGDALVVQQNDAGFLFFQKSLGAEGAVIRIQNLVYTDRGALLEFGDSGPVVHSIGEPNAKGALPVSFIDQDRRLDAGIWSPRRGLRKLDVGRARGGSAALFITARGEVGGWIMSKADPNAWPDTLFVRSDRRQGRELTVRPSKFRRMLRRAGEAGLEVLDVRAMNDRLEFIGTAETSAGRIVNWLYSPEFGLHTIDSLLEAAGVEGEMSSIHDINERGEILLSIILPDRATTVVLSPPQ